MPVSTQRGTLFPAETFDILHSRKEAMVEVATELLGSLSMRYVTGHLELGQSPETGFDCSGLIKFVLAQVGLHVPDYIGQDDVRRPIRHVNEFRDHYGVTVGCESEDGDLIFFTRRGLFPTHVGIVAAVFIIVRMLFISCGAILRSYCPLTNASRCRRRKN